MGSTGIWRKYYCQIPVIRRCVASLTKYHLEVHPAISRTPVYTYKHGLHTTCKFYQTNDISTSSTVQHKLGKQEARMAIIFTCKICNERQTKTFSKLAYNKGVVIIECQSCKNRHLIADNLGWFNHVDAR